MSWRFRFMAALGLRRWRRIAFGTSDGRRLPLGVAGPGADHAFLAAEFVALLGRGIERAGNLRFDGIAMGAAGIFHVDRERRAGALHGHRGAVALALLQRREPGCGLGGIVIGLAIGAAFADREGAGRP